MKPLLAVPVITDIHWASENHERKLGSLAEERLIDVFRRISEMDFDLPDGIEIPQFDFALNLGDNIISNGKGQPFGQRIKRIGTDLMSFRRLFNDLVNTYTPNLPWHNLRGNHEERLGKDGASIMTGAALHPVSFDVNGIHVVLANFNNRTHDENRKYKGFNLGQSEIEKLEEILKSTQLPTAVFSHQFLGHDPDDFVRFEGRVHSEYENAEDIQSLIDKFPHVFFEGSGHAHLDKRIIRQTPAGHRRDQIRFNSLTEEIGDTKNPHGSVYLLLVFDDHVRVLGFGHNKVDYKTPIPKPEIPS